MEPAPDPAPAVQQIATPPDRLVVTTVGPGVAPATAFAWWTEPAQICRWWPTEAEIAARAGGAYHLAWPAMNWHLRGQYTTVEPGRRLAFTWHWDHEPSVPVRTVEVIFVPDAGGTRLTVTHGTYTGSPADQDERQGHLDGWTHFLTRLRGLF